MITYFIMKKIFDNLRDPCTTLANDENLKGRRNKSFWMVAILWAITLPLCWFLIPGDFVYHHIMVIVGGILELFLAIFSELEHTTIMHDAAGNFEDDSYYWNKAGGLLSAECCMVFGIFMGIMQMNIFSSVTFVYIIMMLLIIWLPRLMIKPW